MAEFQAGMNEDNVYGRTAKLTGVSESTIRRIVDEGFKNGGKFSTPGKHRKGRPTKHIDDFDICSIRQKVQFFYTVQKEVPTLRKLLAVVINIANKLQYIIIRHQLKSNVFGILVEISWKANVVHHYQ
ncbi:unnamed protein product, partial [Brenthis ino]